MLLSRVIFRKLDCKWSHCGTNQYLHGMPVSQVASKYSININSVLIVRWLSNCTSYELLLAVIFMSFVMWKSKTFVLHLVALAQPCLLVVIYGFLLFLLTAVLVLSSSDLWARKLGNTAGVSDKAISNPRKCWICGRLVHNEMCMF